MHLNARRPVALSGWSATWCASWSSAQSRESPRNLASLGIVRCPEKTSRSGKDKPGPCLRDDPCTRQSASLTDNRKQEKGTSAERTRRPRTDFRNNARSCNAPSLLSRSRAWYSSAWNVISGQGRDAWRYLSPLLAADNYTRRWLRRLFNMQIGTIRLVTARRVSCSRPPPPLKAGQSCQVRNISVGVSRATL